MGARLTLLRVIKPTLRYSYHPEEKGLEAMTSNMVKQIDACQTKLLQEAQTYLEGVAARLRGRATRIETRVVAEDQPAVGILREAQDLDVNLIAMETHGRRGLSRLLLGSVADKVVRGGHLPILLHRPVQA